MTTAATIIFDNLLAEAKYAFAAEDYDKAEELLSQALDVATLGRLVLGGNA